MYGGTVCYGTPRSGICGEEKLEKRPVRDLRGLACTVGLWSWQNWHEQTSTAEDQNDTKYIYMHNTWLVTLVQPVSTSPCASWQA